MTNQKTPEQGGATEEQIEAAQAAAAAIRDAHRARDIELFSKGQDGREAGTICAQCGWQLVPMYAWQEADVDGHDAAVEREAMRAALAVFSASASAHPAGERHDAEGAIAPPVYLALDVWQALGLPVGEFDAYYERNGWADTWSNLMYAPGGVSRRPICGAVVDGEPCVLREHSNGPHMGAGDVGSTEVLPQAEPEGHAAPVTGDRGERSGTVARQERDHTSSQCTNRDAERSFVEDESTEPASDCPDKNGDDPALGVHVGQRSNTKSVAAPISDREKLEQRRDLIYHALRDAGEGRTTAENLSRTVNAALAAPVEVDAEKLAHAIADELETDSWIARSLSNGKINATARRLVEFAVKPVLRGEGR